MHKARYPLHVTVRVRGGLPRFAIACSRTSWCGSIAASHRDEFRVLHFSIQDNHVHLIVEAHDATSLARGMQRLNARIARGVNGMLGIRGQVWRERYHARELTTPRSVRNALVYVLMNAKKHGYRFASGIDPLSSVVLSEVVRAPRTWLAGVGWRRRGLIRADERPRAPD